MAESLNIPDYNSDDADERTPLVMTKRKKSSKVSIVDPAPIVTQPSATSHISPSISASSFRDPYTVGLNYLRDLDTVFIDKKIGKSGVLNKNIEKFFLKNNDGDITYFIIEISSVFDRIFYGSSREINMMASDMYNNKVFRIKRSMNCECFCIPCSRQHFRVFSPMNDPLGAIDQEWKFLNLSLVVKDATGAVKCRVIHHHFKEFSFNSDKNYKIFAADGETEIGLITKFKKANDDSFDPRYSLRFPNGICVTTKVLLVATLFAIHYMYYD